MIKTLLAACTACGLTFALIGCSETTPPPKKNTEGQEKADLGSGSNDPGAMDEPAKTDGAAPAKSGDPAPKTDGEAGGPALLDPAPKSETPPAAGKAGDLDSLLEGEKKGTADTEKTPPK